MNASIFVLAPLAALLLGGCSTPSSQRLAPRVNPGLIMLTPEQARRYGVMVEPPTGEASPPAGTRAIDTSAAIVAPEIKAYGMNRLVDPFDAELMHEAHVVYRRETPPRWRLGASVERQILIGPRITDGRQDLQPALEKEIGSMLADERRANEANRQAITTLFQAVEALSRQQQALLRPGPAREAKPRPTEPKPEPAAEPMPPDRS